MIFIKKYALAALGILTAFFGFMWQMTRAKHEKAVKNGIKEARKTEKKAVESMIEGMEKEDEIIQDTTSVDRNHFS